MDFELHALKLLDNIQNDVILLKVEMAKVKITSGMWGVIGGLAASTAPTILSLLKSTLSK